MTEAIQTESNGESDAGRAKILEEVSRMIREVIGEDWALDVDIHAETSFSKDLELESIEFVALAEKLRDSYGKRIDFAGWLAGMELKEILGLHVGQLVEFIAQCLSRPETA
jgi:acyl carrier protein